jgi:DNA-binding transcriptional ArsR family regulator
MQDTIARDPLSTTFAALADPTRRAMLMHLSRGEATVKELAAGHAMSLPAVSRHLKVLETAGLVSSRVDGTARPKRLEPAALTVAERWIAESKQYFESKLDDLETHLATMVARAQEEN